MARNLREIALYEPVIVEREFTFIAPGGSSRPVVVKIAQPAPDPGFPESWLCAFRVIGLEKEHRFVAGGVDSMQALVMAIGILSVYLRVTARSTSESVTFLGSTDLGLPDLPPSVPPVGVA